VIATQKPSKTLGFFNVLSVAKGHIVIFHMRARIEINDMTLYTLNNR